MVEWLCHTVCCIVSCISFFLGIQQRMWCAFARYGGLPCFIGAVCCVSTGHGAHMLLLAHNVHMHTHEHHHSVLLCGRMHVVTCAQLCSVLLCVLGLWFLYFGHVSMHIGTILFAYQFVVLCTYIVPYVVAVLCVRVAHTPRVRTLGFVFCLIVCFFANCHGTFMCIHVIAHVGVHKFEVPC